MELKIFLILLALEKQLQKVYDIFFNDPSIVKKTLHMLTSMR